MRVGLLSHNARAGDAIGNQLVEKAAFFRDRGDEVRVVVESADNLHPALGTAVLVAGPGTDGPARKYLAAADLIVVEYGHDYPLLGLLPWLAGQGPRILLDYHGVTPPGFWPRHNREAIEGGARRRGLVWAADRVVAHSHFTRRELCLPTAFPVERCHVLGHVAEPRTADSTRNLRAELGLPESAALLLFVGRLAPNKRVPLLVEALHLLHDRVPQLHAVVLGDDTDLYRLEAEHCRRRAAELAVADRLHLLGRVSESRLRDAYRSADVFVMPSVHEGFCIPVAEALAVGLPVVAARAGALPETVGDAGLTFTPDDAADLVRQVGDVLDSSKRPSVSDRGRCLRVAVVGFRYGRDLVGGAERSLRTVADCLAAAGHAVEVFTTCNREESHWSNVLPAGTICEGGLIVHRFLIDRHDRARHLASVRRILQAEDPVSDVTERDYLTHSVHSRGLVAALGDRIDRLDAIIVGPYLFGLTADVATAFPDKTLLMPCFHDEPLARLAVWHAAYGEVGGILYHTPEEQRFAEAELGLGRPGGGCVGTVLDDVTPGDLERGRQLAGTDRPYLLYCGRYSRHKNLPLLLDWAARHAADHPGRFHVAFAGGGDVTIPAADWARDVGYVGEADKRGLMAGAAALVQLSEYESLSLVALEAWAQGTPVLANAACAVLSAQVERTGGGRAVADYDSFAAALEDLHREPLRWRDMGCRGRAFVQANYADRAAFTARLEQAIHELAVPLRDRLRCRGPARAARFGRAAWREEFGRLVNRVMSEPRRPYQEEIIVEAVSPTRCAGRGSERVAVAVRVANRGTHVVVPDGPGRHVLCCRVMNDAGEAVGECESSLGDLVMPDRSISAVLQVPVPREPGTYRVTAWAQRHDGVVPAAASEFRLLVEAGAAADDLGAWGSLLEAAEAALADAARKRELPDEYDDVTQGFLAGLKRAVKRKLLNNFKLAYVDVLSRRQSAFNGRVLAAVQHLAELCGLLGRAAGAERLRAVVEGLSEELGEERRRSAELAARCDRLEARLRRLERAGRTNCGSGTELSSRQRGRNLP
jgi:O-antigen biosynthesis protein